MLWTHTPWKEHITSVARVCTLKVGLFLTLSKFLKFDILCKLYFTLVVPHLDYIVLLLLGVIVRLHIPIYFKRFKTDWLGSSQKTTIIQFVDLILLSS